MNFCLLPEVIDVERVFRFPPHKTLMKYWGISTILFYHCWFIASGLTLTLAMVIGTAAIKKEDCEVFLSYDALN